MQLSEAEVHKRALQEAIEIVNQILELGLNYTAPQALAIVIGLLTVATNIVHEVPAHSGLKTNT